METSGHRPQISEGLTAAAFRGMSWSYLSSILVALTQVFYVGVTSRLLSPRAFGLYAIALLAINVGNTFAGMGVAQALVQRPSISRDDVRAAHMSGVGIGLLFFAAQWLLAPAIAAFFTEPEAIPALRVMALHFLFLGFGLTSQALLRREHRFRELAITHCVSNGIGYGIVGPVMAVAGAGVWSLAGAVLSAHFLHAAFEYYEVRHSLKPIFAVRTFRSLYGFGARVSVLTLLEFLGKQLDTFAVGRYATTALLGQYSRAFVVVSLPMSQHLTQAITRVMFPGFSRIQGDLDRLRRTYLSIVTLGGTLMLGVAAGMAVAAREIVLVLLGGQWDVAIRLVPFFALAVAMNIMTRFAQLVCQSRAELSPVLVLQGLYVLLLGVGYVVVSGLRGVVPFAAALALAEVVRHLAHIGLLRRIVGIRLADVALAYIPAVVTAAGVAGFVFLARQIVRLDGVPIQAVLAAEILAGAIGLALFTRFNPFPRVRSDLHARLAAAGVIGRHRALTKLALLLVGRPPSPPAATVVEPMSRAGN